MNLSAATNESATLSQQYQSKTEKEHILHAPDTYIGSIDKVLLDMDIYEEESQSIVRKMVEFVPGLYKLFDEGIVNARDHAIRMQQRVNDKSDTKSEKSDDKKETKGKENETKGKEKKEESKDKLVTTIQIDVQPDGTISIENDGNGIDVAQHPDTGLWIPEMIFGHLRTSTNYNTDEKKIVGGKNGFGFKLVLIWSTIGSVETVDHVRQLKYVQTFANNLNTIGQPVISKVAKTVKPMTKVTFKPDYKRLGFEVGGRGWQPFVQLLKKRAYDIAACTDAKVKVVFNREQIPIKGFQQYSGLYKSLEESAGTKAYESAGPRWEYSVTLSPANEFKQISFVNGICTFKGGRHVDYIMNQIVKQITDTIEKKKKIKVPPQAIKEQIMLFLRCDIENPAFDSQSKEFMTTPVAKFGSTCEVSAAFCKKVMDMGVADAACEVSELRENRATAKKANGSKSKTVRGIANLSDANWAGGAKSGECTLILCEGLSAMAGIVSGLTKEDQNTMGIYPLKGKLLNVRDMPLKRVTENKEIGDLIKILGLEVGKTYCKESIQKCLRYGKIMIMCDQDVDGSHIKGLCINLFQSHWRSLFETSGFLSYMNTPILRATKRNEVLTFYNESEYDAWKTGTNGTGTGTGTAGWQIKYFKGLGTSTAKEFKEYFAHKKVIDYTFTGLPSNESIDMMFNKKRADDRKQLLENYDKTLFLPSNRPLVPYEEFVQKELLHFSSYDCERSIPNVMDGWKTSNRKVLYACFKRNLVHSEIKVAQLSGYVSEHTLYHHGEASLNGAIVAMAQSFVGSNNINVLLPNGQFGSRLAGGEDSASERYIFTLLNPLTRLLFPEADDSILAYLDEDGVQVEPEFYVPIVPLILVNGSTGIGTGFSCHVPSFDVQQIIRYLKARLQDTPLEEDFIPFYEGFQGTVSHIADTEGKYLIRGKYEKTGKPDQIRITELPVGTWTLPYKAFLESLCDPTVLDKDGKKVAPLLKDVMSYSTDTAVDFVVDLLPGKLEEWTANGSLEKVLKLTTTVSTTNMHLFDEGRRLRKYETVLSILEAFVPVRMALYQTRKDALLKQGNQRLCRLKNKARYIQELLDDVIDLRKKTASQVVQMLKERQFSLEDSASDTSGGLSEKGFHYLTKMPMDSVSVENRDSLVAELNKVSQELAELQKRSIEQMWIHELDAFSAAYAKGKEVREKERQKDKSNSKDVVVRKKK